MENVNEIIANSYNEVEEAFKNYKKNVSKKLGKINVKIKFKDGQIK